MNNIAVEVLSAEVIERSGTFDGRDGESINYTTRKQKAKLEANGFAYPYDVRLEDGQKPYPVGKYFLDVASMVSVNKGVASYSKYAVLVPVK